MCVGVRISTDNGMKWSTNHRGYWTDYVVNPKDLIKSLDNGGLGKSVYQDYTPVLPLLIHRWNDGSRD